MLMKNPRGVKRGPNSSSSFLSTITTVVLVAFCVVGVWFYTSSSSSSSVVSATGSFPDRLTTRLSLRDGRETDPPPALDDTEGELPEDAIKDDQNLQEEKQINRSEENDIQSEVQQQNHVHSEEQQKDEQSSEEQQQQKNADVSNQQQENSDVAEKQKVESNGGEEVSTENVSNEGEEFHPQIDEKVQRDIEEGEGGGGITSQAQVEHDTEGTSEEQSHDSKDNPNGSDSITGEPRVEVSDENGKTWATQADRSVDEKERWKEEEPEISNGGEWEVCNVTAGPDYIPCLDNEKAIRELHSFKHFEHRERHCPEEGPTCLVPLPEGYKRPIEWPQSRDKVIDKMRK